MAISLSCTFRHAVYGLLSIVVFGATTVLPSVADADAVAIDDTDYVGSLVVVTRPLGSFVACGQSLTEFAVVVIDPNGRPAFRMTMGFDGKHVTGDRVVITSQASCGDGFAQLTTTEVTPGPLSFAAGGVSPGATVDETNILVVVDVVSSVTNETGTYCVADVLVLGSGRPELVSVALYGEEPVQPGDRFDVWFADADGLLLAKD